MLNRSALILRPAQPFIEWAASVDDSGLAPDPKDEQTVYLLPNWYDGDEGMRLVEMAYQDLFERELTGWHTDPRTWPKNRSFEMFLEWFTIEQHSIIEDLCEFELEDEEEVFEDEPVDLSDPEQLAEVLAMFERISAGEPADIVAKEAATAARAKKAASSAQQAAPKATKTASKTKKAAPKATKTASKTKKAAPKAKKAAPKAKKAAPKAKKAAPKAKKAASKAKKAAPKAKKAAPKAKKAAPKAKKAAPKAKKAASKAKKAG